MWLSVSAIIFQLFKLIMLVQWVLTILELNWNKRLGHEKTKLSICHHTLTSSTHLQNRSFHVVERTRTSTKCQKMKNARAKRAKMLFFIVKYANLWGFCCRRRRGYLSSLLADVATLCFTCGVVKICILLTTKFIGFSPTLLSRRRFEAWKN